MPAMSYRSPKTSVQPSPIRGQGLFAREAIDAGEELTHDWATTDDSDDRMTCHCGSPHCRGTITGKDWMQPALQRRYRGWFCWYLQRKIDALQPATDNGPPPP